MTTETAFRRRPFRRGEQVEQGRAHASDEHQRPGENVHVPVPRRIVNLDRC